MKRSVTLALLLALGMGPAVIPVFAEDGLGLKANIKTNVSINSGIHSSTTSTSTAGDRGEDRGGLIGNIKAEIKGSGGLHADLVRANIKVADRIFTATIDRLDKIIVRINSRLAKLDAAGGSTTEAKGDVSLAQGNITDAKAQISIFSSIDLSTTTSTSTSTLATNYQAARVAAVKARESLTLAKQNLMRPCKQW
jgi:hypothetical protein